MCGICGFITREKITLDELNIMNDTMLHRGPDDSGARIIPLKQDYHLGFACRRLKIIDFSDSARQPMYSTDERIMVVFNGEIFNFPELKNELTDYPFISNSDTEVIIAAYLKWGIDCIYRFNGSFAIALFDKKEDVFYLVRDHIGSKPLYYQIENGNIYFASELKPLIVRPGFGKKIRKDVLSRYLFHQYICHPDSIFSGVFKLPPGALLKMGLHGEAPFSYEIRKWWDIADVYHKERKKPVNDYSQAHFELKELLKKAVARRLISDVPFGTFLSGGFDSSLVTAITAEISSQDVKTFSIGFHEENYNEAKYAKAVSGYLGTKHTEVYIDENDMLKMVNDIPKYYDEPFADSSQIPSMLASGLARRDVNVALCGDGGDELFCGYNIYERIKQAQLLDIPGGFIHGLLNLPGIRQFELEQKLPFQMRVISANRNPETKVQFGEGSYVPLARKMIDADLVADKIDILDVNYPFESRYRVKNWQIRRMLLDMETYIPNDTFTKMDRASMKYSLETRYPFMDKEIIEYSFRLNHSFKYKNGNKKRILKDIAYDYIPANLLDRPKVGFAVPLDKWLKGPLREQLTDMASKEFLQKQGLFNSDYTTKMINNYLKTEDGGPGTGANYSGLMWSFFVFQKWYNMYIIDNKEI